LVSSSQDDHQKMKWTSLDLLKTFDEIDDIVHYETISQFHMADNLFEHIQPEIRNSKKEWIGLCYNRFIEGDSREEVIADLKNLKDVLPCAYYVFKREDKPFISTLRKRTRAMCNFGGQGIVYSPTRGKRIPEVDEVDYTLSSPNGTYDVNLNDPMLDTGCDLTEASKKTLKGLHLDVWVWDEVNGFKVRRYKDCIITIGSTRLRIDLMESYDDLDLLGRDVYNAFKHDVNPKTGRHTWIDQK
jgi:hypothetical protein